MVHRPTEDAVIRILDIEQRLGSDLRLSDYELYLLAVEVSVKGNVYAGAKKAHLPIRVYRSILNKIAYKQAMLDYVMRVSYGL